MLSLLLNAFLRATRMGARLLGLVLSLRLVITLAHQPALAASELNAFLLRITSPLLSEFGAWIGVPWPAGTTAARNLPAILIAVSGVASVLLSLLIKTTRPREERNDAYLSTAKGRPSAPTDEKTPQAAPTPVEISRHAAPVYSQPRPKVADGPALAPVSAPQELDELVIGDLPDFEPETPAKPPGARKRTR